MRRRGESERRGDGRDERGKRKGERGGMRGRGERGPDSAAVDGGVWVRVR